MYCTKGFVHWTLSGWECYSPKDGYESGSHDYYIEDDRAQGELTDSAFALLDDSSSDHETSLKSSLVQFNIILGAYMSALRRAPVELPCNPSPNLLDAIAAELNARTGGRE